LAAKIRVFFRKRRGGPGRGFGHDPAVNKELLLRMQARRGEMRARWNVLLRTEAAASPLAHPDTLVHMLDWSIGEILAALAGPAGTLQAAPRSFEEVRALCPCGRNPLMQMFRVGEQAMVEGLVLCQAESGPAPAAEREAAVAEVYAAVRTVAAQEIESICAVCQHRGTALADCRVAGAGGR
jgi:hypothetical protein